MSFVEAQTAKNLPMRGNVTSGMDRIWNVPRAHVVLTSGPNIATGTHSAVSFDNAAALLDTDGLWSTNNLVALTARTAGRYDIKATVAWAASAAGALRWAYLVKNAVTGTRYANDARTPNGANIVWCTCPYVMTLNAGDTVSLYVFQDTGGNLALSTAASPYSAELALCLIST